MLPEKGSDVGMEPLRWRRNPAERGSRVASASVRMELVSSRPATLLYEVAWAPSQATSASWETRARARAWSVPAEAAARAGLGVVFAARARTSTSVSGPCDMPWGRVRCGAEMPASASAT